MPTLDLHGAINKYAVYNGASDAPLTNPLGNLGALLWHSDLPFVGARQTVTGSINLDPTTSGWVGTKTTVVNGAGVTSTIYTYPYTRTLLTHGQSYAPYFLGYISIGGVEVPLNGSFLYGYHEYNVYSDATGINITCSAALRRSFNYSLSCSFVLRVLNAGTTSSGAAVLPAFFNGFDATDTRMRCGYFDTNNLYLIKATTGDMRFHQGRTIDVQIAQPKYWSSTCMATCVVFQSGSYLSTTMGASWQGAFSSPSYTLAVK